MSREQLSSLDSENSEISIKDIFKFASRYYNFLLSKWLLISTFAMLGGFLGLAYAFWKKPVFTATTTFVLESGENSGSFGQYAGIASMIGLDLNTGGGIFQGNNILELYRSRTMIERTLLSKVPYRSKKILLIDRYVEFNKLREEWAEKKHLKNVQFRADWQQLPEWQMRLQDSLLQVIAGDINRKYLAVYKPDKNSIIRVDVNAEDEFFAWAFNNMIVANVNDFYVQTKTKKSMSNVKILQAKTDSIRENMNREIYSAAAVADATPNLNPTRQLQRTAPMQRSQFSAETNRAILGELVKNLELSKMSLLRETPLIQVVDYPKFPLYKSVPGKITSFIKGLIVFGVLTTMVIIAKKLFSDIMA
jgi:capsule polysaccharide export protein KpsE/RkpR